MANTPKAIDTDRLVADPRAINDLNQSVIKVPFSCLGEYIERSPGVAAASSRAICEWHASEPHVTHDSVTSGLRFGSIRRLWG